MSIIEGLDYISPAVQLIKLAGYKYTTIGVVSTGGMTVMGVRDRLARAGIDVSHCIVKRGDAVYYAVAQKHFYRALRLLAAWGVQVETEEQ